MPENDARTRYGNLAHHTHTFTLHHSPELVRLPNAFSLPANRISSWIYPLVVHLICCTIGLPAREFGCAPAIPAIPATNRVSSVD